jgi:hypothetical protein
MTEGSERRRPLTLRSNVNGASAYNIDIIGSPILAWSLEKLRLQAEGVKKLGDLPDPNEVRDDEPLSRFPRLLCPSLTGEAQKAMFYEPLKASEHSF